MQNNPLVCICIPQYNNQKTIAETLNSIINQTYKNIIIKIFDNASTDNSLEILKNYEHKYHNIYVFQNEKNIGGEANFTRCIENLEGDYGAIYHADDIYLPHMVQKQVEFLEKNEDCSAVAVHSYTIDENSRIISMRYIPEEYTKQKNNVIGNQLELFKSVLKYGNYITCPSVMARTNVYKNDVKSWNGAKFKTSADLDVWLRLASFGKFGLISIPLMQYRESTDSYSYLDTRNRVGENNMFLVLEYYLNKYRNSGLLSEKDLSRFEFLLFKDNVNRTINQMINNLEKKLDIKSFDFNIMTVAVESKMNFKIYMIGLVVKLLRNFKLSKFIKQKIYTYRFKKSRN